MRAVVIGGSGQIGGWLLRVLAERGHHAVGTYATVAFPGLVKLDAADLGAAAAWLTEQRPDVVFYPAGFTWVDGCERDQARAYAANLEEPLNLARAAAALKAKFVYFSTDYVFDGVDGPYSESSPTNPLSVYGRAKRDAEIALEKSLARHSLRSARRGSSARSGRERTSPTNWRERSAPASRLSAPATRSRARATGPTSPARPCSWPRRQLSGLIHVVGPEVIDRVSFARAIASAFGFDPGRIESRPTAELGQGAPRPLHGGLLTTRLDAWRPGLMRPLAAALADFRDKLDDPELRDWVKPISPSNPG